MQCSNTEVSARHSPRWESDDRSRPNVSEVRERGPNASDRAAGAPARGQRVIETTAEAVRPTVARREQPDGRRLRTPEGASAGEPARETVTILLLKREGAMLPKNSCRYRRRAYAVQVRVCRAEARRSLLAGRPYLRRHSAPASAGPKGRPAPSRERAGAHPWVQQSGFFAFKDGNKCPEGQCRVARDGNHRGTQHCERFARPLESLFSCQCLIRVSEIGRAHV